MLYPRKKFRKEKKKMLSLIQLVDDKTKELLISKAKHYDVTVLSLVLDLMREHIESEEAKNVLANASIFSKVRAYCSEKDLKLTNYINSLVKDKWGIN